MTYLLFAVSKLEKDDINSNCFSLRVNFLLSYLNPLAKKINISKDRKVPSFFQLIGIVYHVSLWNSKVAFHIFIFLSNGFYRAVKVYLAITI